MADRDHRTENSDGEAAWTISELAEQAGVTARTIRFYTLEGLLPPPDSRTRYALYGETHLLRLRLIQRLKEAYLPLTAIREQLERLSDAEIRVLLEEQTDEAVRAEIESAAGPPPPAAVKEQKSEGSAADYIARVLAAHGQTLPEVAAPRRRALLVTPPASSAPALLRSPAAPAQAMPAPTEAPAFLKQAKATESESPTAEETQGDTWERIVLSPGVELHIRVPDTPDAREKIDEQIRAAKSLFKSGK